ncbi:MAG: glycosyltransferase family 1 protein [Candidatus Sulfotelmatobacter sp.]
MQPSSPGPVSQPKIRIAYNAEILSNPDVRGLVRYTTELLRALSRRDDVEIVLFSRAELNPQHLRGINAESVVFSALRETLWVDVAVPRKLRDLHIDLFHAPAERGLPLLKPCPFVVTVHESYERTYWRDLYPNLERRLWYWKFELANYYRADALITVSDTTRHKLIELNVTREKQCRRVYLAPAKEFCAEAGAGDPEIISANGLDAPYVLYVGGYDTRKNVDFLVQAFDRASLPDHRLVIVARKEWEYSTSLERWKQLSCFPRLKLLELKPEQIPAVYRHADFFVNPSSWESFSFQLTEAMACGTPLLCSNSTAMPEIAQDAAQYFDPKNRDELVAGLRRFAADTQLKAQLRAKGFERVKAFSWTTTAAETMAIYRELLARKSRPGLPH